MNILTALKVIPLVLPLVITFVKDVEGIFPESGQGSSKLEIVKSALAGILEASNIAINEIWPLLEKIISLCVGIFNIFGIFKR